MLVGETSINSPQSSSYFWKIIMLASLSRLKHSLTVTSTSWFGRSSGTFRLSSYWNKTWIKWKMRNRSWHEPSAFRIPFEFQCEIGQLDANIMHILINAYTQTMENRLLDSDWISIASDGEVKARYAWIKPLLPFPRLPPSLEAPYEKTGTQFLLTAAPHGDGTQSRNQSNEPPLGDSLLSKSDLMPLLSLTLPRDPKGGGFNWLVHYFHLRLVCKGVRGYCSWHNNRQQSNTCNIHK